MGVSSVTGQALKVMQAPRSQGGFDMMPFMTQIGYQFEQQYLNRGRFQAVFEFVPMVSGLEQGKFIPSFNVLNGFRDAKSGIEFAMGPSINFLRMANGYFDEDGEWHLESEWEYYTYDPITYESTYNENPHDIVKRLDSRGVPALQSGFVFAIGKTFRSGHLNIPVNLWVKPQKGGTFYGATFGFNIMEHKKAKNEFKP